MHSNLRYLFLCSCLLTFLFIGCNNKQENQRVGQSADISLNNAEIKSKVEKITQILNKAILENDYDTQLKYFTEDAVIAPPLGPLAKGKKAIKAGYEESNKANTICHAFNGTIEDLWVCGDRVYERGKWAMAQSSDFDKNPKAYFGSYFEIWEIQKDSSLLIDYIIYTLGFNPFDKD